jgi:hypothetical protein
MHGIGGHHAPFDDQCRHHGRRPANLAGVVRHGLLPQAEPKAVGEHRPEMIVDGPLLLGAAERLPINGNCLRFPCRGRQRDEDCLCPAGECRLQRPAIEPAKRKGEASDTGGLQAGKAQRLGEGGAIVTPPLGDGKADRADGLSFLCTPIAHESVVF